MKTKNNIPAYRFQGYTDAWELRKLGDTDTIFTDGNYGEAYPKDSDLTTSSNGVPFLRGSNIQNGRLNLENANYITISKHNELTSGHLEEDDIVIAVRGSLGSIGYVEENNIGWNINSQLAIIRTNKNEIGGRYLIQILLSNSGRKMINSLVTGTALKQLPIKNLKNIQFSLPSLPEQETIGTFFSTLDRHITLHQRKLDTLKEQKKTYLKLLFPAKGQTQPALRFQGFEDDWVEVKLGEVCTIQGGNAWKSDSYSLTGEYLVVTIANVTGEYFIDDKKGNRIDINPNEMQYVLKKGDILISLTGNVGRVSKMTESKGVLNQRVGKLTTTANFEFIFSILRTEKFENEMRLASQGAAQANISNKDVLQYMIPLPSLPEQEVIGTFFQTLDQEIAQVEDKLASLKEMKKTLLRKLFV
ncbi:restriction endonuclease subunit S [Streptococcus suis]|uniref:restriction endonuclease subunit S n=1 Tax=Streptococcus suis TaxID=1307 RepID=UPI001C97A236|nr:restriction endonuclease subunit S [Streptococcus suis]MBY5024255.1 restriction endonuclease subunit S [Streptococcus suis]